MSWKATRPLSSESRVNVLRCLFISRLEGIESSDAIIITTAVFLSISLAAVGPRCYVRLEIQGTLHSLLNLKASILGTLRKAIRAEDPDISAFGLMVFFCQKSNKINRAASKSLNAIFIFALEEQKCHCVH